MVTPAATAVSRTGPSIQATLHEYGAPGAAEQFADELRTALAGAATSLDLTEADTILDRWHALATMAANPLSEAEHAQLARARSGDLTGFRARDEHGNWITL